MLPAHGVQGTEAQSRHTPTAADLPPACPPARTLRPEKQSDGKPKAWVNPFLPYEEALWVAHLSPSHTLLLNKFNVVEKVRALQGGGAAPILVAACPRHLHACVCQGNLLRDAHWLAPAQHVLVVTREFESQADPLNARDLGGAMQVRRRTRVGCHAFWVGVIGPSARRA